MTSGETRAARQAAARRAKILQAVAAGLWGTSSHVQARRLEPAPDSPEKRRIVPSKRLLPCDTCEFPIGRPDDHLRNHGFLYAGPDGWRLAPAYDLNPVPTDIKPRVLTTAIDLDDGTASLDLAMDVAAYFELGPDAARAVAAEVGQAVATWRQEAARAGLTSAETDRMASAFEHEDLTTAAGL